MTDAFAVSAMVRFRVTKFPGSIGYPIGNCEMVSHDLLLKLDVLLRIDPIQRGTQYCNCPSATFNCCPMSCRIDPFGQPADYHNLFLDESLRNLTSDVKTLSRRLSRPYDGQPRPWNRDFHRTGSKQLQWSILLLDIVQWTQKLFGRKYRDLGLC